MSEAARTHPGVAAFTDEGALVSGLLRGEPLAGEILVHACQRRLLAIVRRYLRHEADVEDTVQDTFVQALQALPRFRGGSSLCTWLHRIAINQALMTLRRRGRRPEVALDSEEEAHRRALVVPGGDVESRLIEADARGRMLQGIADLPPRYREVVRLMDIEGRGPDQAAGILGVSPNAAKLRLMRARKQLRARLAPVQKIRGSTKR